MKRIPKLRTWVPTIEYPRRPDFRILLATQDVRGFLIPRGYVWNGASIPKVVRPLIGSPFDGPFVTAALLHDFLYETHGASRTYADQLFHAELLTQGAGAVRAYTMYSAVRMFGAENYNEKSIWNRFLTEDQLRTLGVA